MRLLLQVYVGWPAQNRSRRGGRDTQILDASFKVESMGPPVTRGE